MTRSAPALYGLILAGGKSSRMQRDKAALRYHGKTQLDRAFELAARHTEKTFVSVRADQQLEATRASYPLIVDSVSSGPLAGIRSALAAFPESSWLVIACDLPFLSDAALTQLVSLRDPNACATAFRGSLDGLPEPLCAIWEAAAAASIAAYADAGGHCPRKFLLRHATHLLEARDARALDNINTPEEYAQAQRILDVTVEATPMHLTIHYFALMREQAGRSEETLDTRAATPADLYIELTQRYGFTLSRAQLKVAVNSEFCAWERPLAAGDAVVFIPPVAGG